MSQEPGSPADPNPNATPTMDDLLATELGQDKETDPDYYTFAKSAVRTEAIDQPAPSDGTVEANLAKSEEPQA